MGKESLGSQNVISTREPLKPFWKKVLHIIILILGWLIYFYFLATLQLHERTVIALVFLLIFIVVIPCITLWWIYHNIRIYRKQGLCTNVNKVEEQYARDWEGKEIVADWKQMKQASHIRITISDKKKVYDAV